MNNSSRENLEKLYRFIVELSETKGNEWFKEKLAAYFSNNELGFSNFPEFIKFQKKQFRKKGRNFYKEIEDANLKRDLVQDFVEMCWYQTINQNDRFLLFCFYQMENMLNHYIFLSEAHEKISLNKDYYTISFSKKFTVIPYDNFFYKKNPNSIEKISIWAKIVFWMIDSNNQEWGFKNQNNFSRLVNIRNEYSHRFSIINDRFGKNEKLKKTKENYKNSLEFYNNGVFSNLGFFINILSKIKTSLSKINPKVEKHEVHTRSPKLLGPTFTGQKIDLDKFKR